MAKGRKPKPKPQPQPTRMTKRRGGSGEERKKKLIISTGDASDFDGYMALPLYYKAALKHNADVAFVMNYPAYLRKPGPVIGNVIGNVESSMGKGFTYGFKDFLTAKIGKNPNKNYSAALAAASNEQDIDAIKMYMTAFDVMVKTIVDEIWNWCNTTFKPQTNDPAPQLIYVFDHESINEINPFSADIVKDELDVYGFDMNVTEIQPDFDNVAEFINHVNTSYGDVYMDMNGSMAWLGPYYDTWNRMNSKPGSKVAPSRPSFFSKVCRCFVMGGVMDDYVVDTMSVIPKVLNRISSATMNQLYAPKATKQLFDDLGGEKLVFITNNEINAKFNFVNEPHYAKFKNAMIKLQLIPPSESDVTKYFDKFYEPDMTRRKPFDVISAFYLCNEMDHTDPIDRVNYIPAKLFFNSEFGSTILTKPDIEANANANIAAQVTRPTFKFLDNEQKINLAEKMGTINTVRNELALYKKIKDDEFSQLSEYYGVSIAATGEANYVDTSSEIIEFIQSAPLTSYDALGYTVPIQVASSGGGKRRGMSKTTERVTVNGRSRVIFVGKRGGRYIKQGNEYVALSKLKPRR